MKKLLLPLLALMLALISVVGLASCGADEFSVNFIVDGEVYAVVVVGDEEAPSLPAEPTREGYTFAGWYLDEAFENPFTAESLSGDVRVYAKWVEKHEHSYTEKNVDDEYLAASADCEHAATYYYSCACGAVGTKTFEYGEPNGHSYTQKNTDIKYLATSADCEHAATYYYSCACGAAGNKIFMYGYPNGHNYIAESTDGKYLATAADCEHAATYYYSCAVCGVRCWWVTFNYGEPNGHSYTKKNTDIKYLATSADCEHAATYYYSCACGAVGTKTFEYGKPSEHRYVLNNVDAQYLKTPATEYSPAEYYKSCACGKASTTATFTYGDALPGYLTYRLSEDGLYYVVTGFVGIDENVSIPERHEALPVCGIAENAFENNATMRSITIPNSVTSIGWETFKNCSALTSISLPFVGDSKDESSCAYLGYIFGAYSYSENYKYVPSSLKTVIVTGDANIGSSAFWGCTGLTSVTIGNGVTSIGSSAFWGCTGLTSVTIGNSVTSIGSSAFSGCTGLTSVTIGNSVTSIGDRAFYNCGGLTSITIPNNVTSIGDSAFFGCMGLTSVTIGNGVKSIGINAFYGCYKLVEVINNSTLDITPGSFYNYGGVACYAKEVHSDESRIKNVDDYLFYTFDGINYLLGYLGTDTELTLPKSYNSQSYKIHQYAFYGDEDIISIIIPDSVTSIGDYAFYGCTGLTSIKYGGSSEEWTAIKKGRYWNLNTGSYTITYNYTDEE